MMDYQDQTREQLIAELVELRQRVADQDVQLARTQQVETALRESERRLATLLSNLPGAVYRCKADRNWTVEFLSDGYFSLTGYEPSQLIGRPGTCHSELIHPDDRQREFDVMQKAVAKRCPFQVEYRLHTASGQETWVAEQGQGVFSESGELEAIEGFSIDITDRKRAEAALRASEAKYRRLYESMMDAFVSVTMDGKIHEYNEAYRQMLGYEAEELATLTFRDLTPSKWHAFQDELIEKQVLVRGYSDIYEKEYRRKDGTVVPVELRTILLRDDQGQPCGMWAVLRDITERKHAEEASRKAHDELEQKVKERTAELAIFRRFVEASGRGFGMADLQGNVTYVNATLCRLLGETKPEDVVGEHIDTYYPEAQRQRRSDEIIPTLLREGSWQGEAIIRSRQGRPIPVVLNMFLIRDDKGNPIRLATVIADISKRKAAEADLRQSRDELQAIYDGVVDGLLIADAETKRFVRANTSICHMLGYSETELLSSSVADIHPTQNLPGVLEAFQAQLEGRLHVAHSLPLLRKDGSTIHADITSNRIVYNGRPCLIGVFRDITERKAAQEALRRSEERLRLAIAATNDAIWDCNLLDGTVTWNDNYAASFGRPPESNTSWQWWIDRIHPEDRDRVVSSFKEALQGSEHSWTAEYRFLRADGLWADILDRANIARNDSGEAWRVVGAMLDITDRKRAEEAIRKSEAKHRALIESCPDSVVMSDLQGRITFASQRAAEQHGLLHPEELIGKAAADLVVETDRDRFRASIGRLLEEGIHRNVEYRGLRKDGSTFDAEIVASVIRDAAGNPEALMAVYRDITGRKQTENELRAKNAELLAAAEIQAHLLPQEAPQVPGFDIAGQCYPAEMAAGDHFDYLWLPDGSLLMAMGDVSGHGIGPAIVAADFCARLRTLSETLRDLPEIAMRVNAGLYQETAGERFVTAILGRLDPKSRRLAYLNAGHPPAIVLNSAGAVKARLAHGGLAFAVLPKTPFVADDSVELADGDLVLFYTDGLVEVGRHGEPLFGIDRVIQVVRANQNRTAAEIIEALHHAARQYAGAEKTPDDITAIVVKVLTRTPEVSPAL